MMMISAPAGKGKEMTDREKLIELLRVPIYPHLDADPAEVVADYLLDNGVVVREKGEWEDGKCSNCHEEALSTSWDEPVYDYDWEENLRYSHTEKHTEYHLTSFCPNCGADMRKGENDG
jgi:hypothetical protein